MAQLISEEALSAIFARELGEGMRAAAEPIVQKALADIEDAMRKKLAAMLVGVITSGYNLARDGRDLVVRVHLGAAENKGVGHE